MYYTSPLYIVYCIKSLQACYSKECTSLYYKKSVSCTRIICIKSLRAILYYTSPSLLLRSLRSRHLRSLQLDSFCLHHLPDRGRLMRRRNKSFKDSLYCLHHLPDKEENSDFFTIVDDKDDVDAKS